MRVTWTDLGRSKHRETLRSKGADSSLQKIEEEERNVVDFELPTRNLDYSGDNAFEAS